MINEGVVEGCPLPQGQVIISGNPFSIKIKMGGCLLLKRQVLNRWFPRPTSFGV